MIERDDFDGKDEANKAFVALQNRLLKAELEAAQVEAKAARTQAAQVEIKAAKAQANADRAEAEEAKVKAINADLTARNQLLELQIEQLRRDKFRTGSESARRLIDQLELEFEELEATATEDEIKARRAAEKTTQVQPFERKRTRRDFPDHLPVERVVIPAPENCPCCGSDRLHKLGEQVTQTLERVPAVHKIIATVRERFSCRDCETITQPPAPFHVTPRGMFGPHFLAALVFQKYGLHQPLNSQRDQLARAGIPLSLSTLADQIGACAVALSPIHSLIEAHVLAAGRLHGDDTTVQRLARYKTETARMWTYICDDQPFAGGTASAALFYYSRDRKGEHPQDHLQGYRGILQADNFPGYNKIYQDVGDGPPVIHAACWAHARRKFYELVDIAGQLKKRKNPRLVISPLAAEAVERIDRIFDIERDINGKPAAERLAVRQALSAPLVADLGEWMRDKRSLLSNSDAAGKAMNYMLNDWGGFARFLTDGRICLTNNAAERALRSIAQGRKAWLFVGSDRGGERAAVMYGLITTCRLNDVDPLAWLSDVLARIADLPQNRLHELLPWNWARLREAAGADSAVTAA